MTNSAVNPIEETCAGTEQAQLKLKLENAKEALKGRCDELAAIVSAEQNAHRFLSLAKEGRGFTDERMRAEEITQQCAERRPKVEEYIENRRKQIKQIEAQLACMPLDQLRRVDELHELAKSLRMP